MQAGRCNGGRKAEDDSVSRGRLSSCRRGRVVGQPRVSSLSLVADSGKTTLVAGLCSYTRGTVRGLSSPVRRQPCPALKATRCYLARMASGLTSPDTERTKHSDSQHLLHLRLAELSPLRPPRHSVQRHLRRGLSGGPQAPPDECPQIRHLEKGGPCRRADSMARKP